MIILIDMDDVLSDFDGEFYRKWNTVHPDKQITPQNEKNCFYLTDESPKEYAELIRGIYTTPGFVRSLPEIPGSINALNVIASRGHKIFICTTPLNAYQNCVKEKYEWIEEHLGFEWTKKLILTKDKTLVQGDILIDDKPEVTGAAKPVWEHIVFDKPYNKNTNHARRMTWANYKKILFNE
jgi:5'-nucleotidase